MIKKITKSFIFLFFTTFVLSCVENGYTRKYKDQPQLLKGGDLFHAQCRSCHQINKKLVGPALAGVSKKYEEKWLLRFIRNSKQMIDEGDKRAKKVFEEHNGALMPSYNISNDDIRAILAFIKAESE